MMINALIGAHVFMSTSGLALATGRRLQGTQLRTLPCKYLTSPKELQAEPRCSAGRPRVALPRSIPIEGKPSPARSPIWLFFFHNGAQRWTGAPSYFYLPKIESTREAVDDVFVLAQEKLESRAAACAQRC